MWRNFGWMAILATWTIFLILNSGLTGEWIFNNLQINNEYTPYKVHQGSASSTFDRKAIYDSMLRHAKKNFKSNDHLSMHTKAVFLEFKNMENRDLRFSGYEKDDTVANAIATPRYLKDADSDKNSWLTTKKVATKNMWLLNIIIMEKSRNTKKYYKFVPPSHESKSTLGKKRGKEKTTHTVSYDRKKAAKIRRDTRACDKKSEWHRKKHKRERIFSGENRETAFFPDKFAKHSRNGSSIREFKNSDILKLKTIENTEFGHTDEKREYNGNDENSRPSLTKNGADEMMYVNVEANDGSQISETTFPNYSSLKENQNGNVGIVTDDTLTENSPYKRSVRVAWSTLIFNSKILNANREIGNEENRVSPHHSPKSEYSKSYKTGKFPSETYKRHEYSKIGLKVNTEARERRKGNVGDIVDSFTFHFSPNSLDSHLAIGGRSVSFMKGFSLRKEKNALKMTRGTSDSRREYQSFIKNIGARINRKATDLKELQIRRRTREKEIIPANYATHNEHETKRDLLPTNLFATGIDRPKIEYPTSARISITQRRNPMHARYVRSNSDCEHPRTTDYEAQVSNAFRFGLRNVSDSSELAKFGKPLDQKDHSRVKYLRKFNAIDAEPPRITEIIDGRSKRDGELRRTLTENESISLDATNVGDNPTEMRMINGYAQSSGEPRDESGLENVRIRSRDGNYPDTHEESGFYSRSSDIHNSKYRRYKRHEVRNSLGNPTSTELDRETWKTFDTIRPTTSNFLIKFTTNPSVSVTQASNMEQVSTNANFLATVKTLPSSGYEKFPKESIPSMTTQVQHNVSGTNSNGSDLLKTMQVDIPKTINVSSIDTSAFLIKTLDRSTAVTKIDKSVILKEISSSPEMNLQVSNVTSKSIFDMSLIEPINLQEEYGMHGNGSIVSTIEPFPQRSINSSRNVLEGITTENVGDSSTDEALSEQWPVKHSAVVEGDLVLGGLMMVHEREDTITCGPVMPQGGIQALEAMLYTLDNLNDREIVPGVKIGAHILDDCDKDTYGLEMAFLLLALLSCMCSADDRRLRSTKQWIRKIDVRKIENVSRVSSQIRDLNYFNGYVNSMTDTVVRMRHHDRASIHHDRSRGDDVELRHPIRHGHRQFRSTPIVWPVKKEAVVEGDLVLGGLMMVHEREDSVTCGPVMPQGGIQALEAMLYTLDTLNKQEIMPGVKIGAHILDDCDKDTYGLEMAVDFIKGCIIFGSDQEVAGVMRAVRRCNATGAFSWIGSDGWSARGLVSNGNEPEVEGTLSVQPQANPVKGFEEYFLNLTVENNRRNPWFVGKRMARICDGSETWRTLTLDMHLDLCDGKQGLCDAMKPTKGITLLHYLRKVDFEGLSGDKFRFDKNGDGPARYNIIHFKQVEPGKYKWIRVGKYLEGELRLNMSGKPFPFHISRVRMYGVYMLIMFYIVIMHVFVLEIQFKLGHPQPPESVCSLPCELGQAKKYVEGEKCCWHCFNCTQYQIRHPKDETQCIQCRRGTLPDETHSICRDVPEEFLRPESAWAISAMSFSATGILVTLFVGGVFLKHNDTPVVRASGRELSYVLLSGILLCYLVTFTLILKPTDVVCSIQRFAAGFCFTVVYAALLTKTNRISRIFNAGSAKRPSFISPRSQLIICSGLVFVQILINGVWIIVDPAEAMHHYPTMEDNLLVCNNYIDASYMIAFAYPTILIIVCTVYAVLTRKIPEAFNESKHIGLTMYTTCVIWCAFIPLYYGTGSNVALRITSMSVTISLSASVTVVCLFSPKLYIILIRPERNVRPTVRAGRPNLTKSSAITATNASNMMGPVTATTVLTAATCDQNKAIKKHIAIDCSTQSECYELQLKDQKNGESLVTRTSRSTQTINNEKEFVAIAAIKESPDVIASVNNKESKSSTITAKRLNSNARIGNGPLSQSDLSL
ncbi:hypothetical protein ACFW04_005448 [Cataglyphis niger]